MSTLISFTLKSATLCGVREPVDVALRHVGGVPAVEDVGAHVAPVLLVDALAAGRAVAAVEVREGYNVQHISA